MQTLYTSSIGRMESGSRRLERDSVTQQRGILMVVHLIHSFPPAGSPECGWDEGKIE